MKLRGCFTALVTPFENNKVSFSALTDLIEAQIAGGIDGLVPVGTTGESPTLEMTEHRQVIEHVVKTVNGRCLVIAGTGANATAEALELTQFAKDVGADASLQVTPYYNRPTQEGLYRHFASVAEKVGLPIILYNVPGRTGTEIAISTIARLTELGPHVAAVKEAGGRVDRVSAIRDACDITVLSGDDPLTLPMIAVGASGVISVASNLLPKQMTQLTHAALDGRFADAQQLHFQYYALCKGMMSLATNPIPIKTAMALQGMIKEEFRLPLWPMEPENKEQLRRLMTEAGLD